MAEADFNSNFNAWFTGGVAAGQIEPNADRVIFMAKFAAAQLEKATSAVRGQRGRRARAHTAAGEGAVPPGGEAREKGGQGQSETE